MEQEDLFEHYDKQPQKVQDILARYSDEEGDYSDLEELKSELEAEGYTFDYGLDAVPYDLRKMKDGGSTYQGGGEVYNAHILTENNTLIHRRYKKEVTHKDIYNEYKKNGVVVKDSIIHYAKPVDFYDFISSETKKYVKKNMGEDVDTSSIFITSKQVGNEYIASEIKGNTVSGKDFTIKAKQLFDAKTKFKNGGQMSNTEEIEKIKRALASKATPEFAKAKLQAKLDALQSEKPKAEPKKTEKAEPKPKAPKAKKVKDESEPIIPKPKSKRGSANAERMKLAKVIKAEEGLTWSEALKEASWRIKNGVTKRTPKAKKIVRKTTKVVATKPKAKIIARKSKSVAKVIAKKAPKKIKRTIVLKRSNKLVKVAGSKERDKEIKALHAGKRQTAWGTIYYENRSNRADKNRTTRLKEGGGVGNSAEKTWNEMGFGDRLSFMEEHFPERKFDVNEEVKKHLEKIKYKNLSDKYKKVVDEKFGNKFAKGGSTYQGGGEIKVGDSVNLPEIKFKHGERKGEVQFERVDNGIVKYIEDDIYGVYNPKTKRIHKVTKSQIEIFAKGGKVGKKSKTIKRPKRDYAKDKEIKALHSGKRTTDWGTTYVENRPNRSDKNRTKKI